MAYDETEKLLKDKGHQQLDEVSAYRMRKYFYKLYIW